MLFIVPLLYCFTFFGIALLCFWWLQYKKNVILILFVGMRLSLYSFHQLKGTVWYSSWQHIALLMGAFYGGVHERFTMMWTKRFHSNLLVLVKYKNLLQTVRTHVASDVSTSRVTTSPARWIQEDVHEVCSLGYFSKNQVNVTSCVGNFQLLCYSNDLRHVLSLNCLIFVWL